MKNTKNFTENINSVHKIIDNIFPNSFEPDVCFLTNFATGFDQQRYVFVSQKQNPDSKATQFVRKYVSIIFTKGFEENPKVIDNREVTDRKVLWKSVVDNSLGDSLISGIFGPFYYQNETKGYPILYQMNNRIEFCIREMDSSIFSLDGSVSY